MLLEVFLMTTQTTETTTTIFCWLTTDRDKSRQRGQHWSNRGCTMYNVSLPTECFFHVYRLEEDVGLLQEGGVRLTV